MEERRALEAAQNAKRNKRDLQLVEKRVVLVMPSEARHLHLRNSEEKMQIPRPASRDSE
jgi:hypothetical protein